MPEEIIQAPAKSVLPDFANPRDLSAAIGAVLNKSDAFAARMEELKRPLSAVYGIRLRSGRIIRIFILMGDADTNMVEIAAEFEEMEAEALAHAKDDPRTVAPEEQAP